MSMHYFCVRKINKSMYFFKREDIIEEYLLFSERMYGNLGKLFPSLGFWAFFTLKKIFPCSWLNYLYMWIYSWGTKIASLLFELWSNTCSREKFQTPWSALQDLSESNPNWSFQLRFPSIPYMYFLLKSKLPLDLLFLVHVPNFPFLNLYLFLDTAGSQIVC